MDTTTQPQDRAPLAWATRRNALILVGAVALARLLFLVFLSPYELAGDEAHYWDWSRRLALSYHTKGPGIAWLIALATSLLGNEEWAIRAPAVLCSALGALATGRLAMACAGGDERAAFLGAAGWLCIPAYHATSMLMTIDAPYILCWILSCLLAWHAARRCARGQPPHLHFALLGIALGVGFLFKYTILLLLPGFAITLLVQRHALRFSRPALLGTLVCTLLFLITISPVIIWNHLHGWPTITHLLGHLGMGTGAHAEKAGPAFSTLWPLQFIGAQLALTGPMIALMALAALRPRNLAPGARAFLISCAAPILLFYLAVAFRIEAEGNWPIAGYTTLIALAAARGAVTLPEYARRLRAWRAKPSPRPREGLLRRKPETPDQVLWHWSAGFGLATGVALLLLAPLDRAPLLADIIPLHRISGHQQRAALVHDARRELARATGEEPIVIASRYDRASLLAYYLPDRPVVYSAASHFGDRRSSYDHFPDTDLADSDLIDRAPPAVLVGGSRRSWSRAFNLDPPHRAEPTIPVFTTTAYRGPRDDKDTHQ